MLIGGDEFGDCGHFNRELRSWLSLGWVIAQGLGKCKPEKLL